MRRFQRHIGIDYSGAETPTASLKGLRVYLAKGEAMPAEVPPPQSQRKYWTRKGIAEWLVERIRPFKDKSLSSSGTATISFDLSATAN